MAAGSSTVEEPPLTIRRPPRFWRSSFGVSFTVLACVAAAFAAVGLVPSAPRPPAEPVVTLKGVMASKADFFNDEEVKRLLKERGFQVEVTRMGSRDAALEVINQKTKYDFAFPSGQPAADLIKRERTRTGDYHRETRLFTSPIVLASYREYAKTLVKNSAATAHGSGQDAPLYYRLDTAKFIEFGLQEKT